MQFSVNMTKAPFLGIESVNPGMLQHGYSGVSFVASRGRQLTTANDLCRNK